MFDRLKARLRGRIRPLLLLLIVFTITVSACAGVTPEPAAQPEPTDTAAPEPMPSPEATVEPEPTDTTAPEPTEELTPDQATAQELWAMLQEPGYPGDWTTIPGKGELYRGQAPHGALLSSYLNPEAAEALQAQPGVMPDGAIIVKENYLEDETFDSVTIMYKQSGYDPDHNDWYWTKLGANGEIQAAGKPDGCIACHGAVRSNDYIFTFPIAPIQAAAGQPSDDVIAMAAELWSDLEAADYPAEWSTVPGKGELYRGQGPHGMLLSTYLNSDAADAMQTRPGEMPDGAVIVKVNYLDDESLDSVTVMSKQAEFDPDHQDWFFAKYGPDGIVQAAGSPMGCVACHGAVRSNDYVFTFPVAPISPSGAPPEVGTPPTPEAMAEEEEKAGAEMGGEAAAELPPAPPREEAVALIDVGGCAGCHVIPGVEGATGTVGPSWCDPAAEVQSGEEALGYVRTSIVDPNADIAEGYGPNIMPQNFGDQFSDDEIDTLVAFIANLECE